MRLENVAFGRGWKDDYFYHLENPRIYGVMTIPVRVKRTPEMAKSSEFDVMAGTRWADPGVVTDRIGASPYQPFPAVLLSNYKTENGVVHGTLSQRVFYHNYLVEHRNNKVSVRPSRMCPRWNANPAACWTIGGISASRTKRTMSNTCLWTT